LYYLDNFSIGCGPTIKPNTLKFCKSIEFSEGIGKLTFY
jgi:hypothetical protein